MNKVSLSRSYWKTFLDRRLPAKNISKGILMLAAPATWSASFIPMAVGFAYAFGQGVLLTRTTLFWIIVSFIAMALIETGKHAVNDLFDFRSGNDMAVDDKHVTPFSGGKKVLKENILSEKQVILIGFITFAGACGLGLLIVIFQSVAVLSIGILGIMISIMYTLPPFKLSYRGLGEVAVGITYGPLVTLGAYFVFATADFFPLLMISLSLGCLITNVLLINEFPDYEADLAAKKMNMLARIGKSKGVTCHLILFILAYLPIILLMITTTNYRLSMLIMLLPLMMISYLNCKKHYDDISKLLLSNKLTIVIHTLWGLLCLILM